MPDHQYPMGETYARALKAAVALQHQARRQLLSAGSPAEIERTASNYIVATDACYEVACEIKGQPA